VLTFIKGLGPEIRQKFKAQRPHTMIAAISFVKREEARLGEENRQTIKISLSSTQT
jgi:hypothetical protein